MAERRPLLIEIGTEELPPKALQRLMIAFRNDLASALEEQRLQPVGVQAFATPRRLAVRFEGVDTRQADEQIERLGPKVEAAYDAAGQATKAAEGFARSCGVDVDALDSVETDKGPRLVWRGVQPGEATETILPGLVEAALGRLPIPKRMRWGSGEVEFVRPVHWTVALLGEQVIPGTILGIPTGRITYGHRFHGRGRRGIEIPEPGAYERLLEEQGHVVADFVERRRRVETGVRQEAERAGGVPVGEEALFDEVTGLVEWPVALSGDFDQRFLKIPEEALISSMQGHQRCFPVRGTDGQLLARFITVANIESQDPQQVRHGNERVIRPRLADAEFFWQQDRRLALGERLEQLRQVVFHRSLGDLHARSQRISRLAGLVTERIGADVEAARRAGLLAKCDLVTEMVDEFPELQGIMGGHYARADGEGDAVAAAIAAHYRPAYAGDALPETPEGQAVSIADRIDTLVGIFAADGAPSADKDPFGLRRAAIGLLRCLIEGGHDLSLREFLDTAAGMIADECGVSTEGIAEQVAAFCHERLRGYYAERGYAAEVFEAVAAVAPSSPLDFHRRLVACSTFRERSEAQTLGEANKRIGNILRRAEVDPQTRPEAVEADGEAAERALAEALREAWSVAGPRIDRGEYDAALTALAELHGPVDRFFTDVMVMAEDEAVRQRRLELLGAVRHAFRAVADLSHLPG
ncbi:glycine--tRNA ligase subunit beta [Halorhodospira halophila]|uniref:Glycine--tRNA ligase beta subunit n=1 Tax=Halorhodospira halophila (strain DSM 244 / SL1) TaxID=349124 RepID=A1WWD4_HALHL|nr:glycine--tRNA ligase subunit beta [Halorhodospira halophila]ABM61996.1 glycyl-tRNA synthetase beta chain [Halorhodospira halophila SL1]MBK1729394.1 glycine--tRNA ligase subunit beta [Halorhodospira halophila]